MSSVPCKPIEPPVSSTPASQHTHPPFLFWYSVPRTQGSNLLIFDLTLNSRICMLYHTSLISLDSYLKKVSYDVKFIVINMRYQLMIKV